MPGEYQYVDSLQQRVRLPISLSVSTCFMSFGLLPLRWIFEFIEGLACITAVAFHYKPVLYILNHSVANNKQSSDCACLPTPEI